MLHRIESCNRILKNKASVAGTALAVFVLLTVALASANAQSFSVIDPFSGHDGNYPTAGLTADAAGNFYGTTSAGGNRACQQGSGCGTVYKLSRSGSGWVLNTIYVFQGGADGWQPNARVLFGPDGSLYGTTEYGGFEPTEAGPGFGTVFKLTPPGGGCGNSCPWTKTTLYRFQGGYDGALPGPGDLTFDHAGNIYGTTEAGGLQNISCFWGTCGVVFELTPSGDGWTEKVVYSFTGTNDGDTPVAGVVFDQHGNLYGTTTDNGPYLYGTVFQLTPTDSGWTENTIYTFQGAADGAFPGGLIMDGDGNLYGVTTAGSPSLNSGGTAFEMRTSASGWTFTVLSEFPEFNSPTASLTFRNGDLYGATYTGGSGGFGTVFELTPGSGGWTLTTLYNFMAHDDGGSPLGSVVVDAGGNVYGTASGEGLYNDGVIFQITP